MNEASAHRANLLYVLIASLGVFFYSHWDAVKSAYVINDDVRQQIYWMQQWRDNELFQNDLLTQYAKNYVPWGVKSIYWAASRFTDPVQVTKAITGLLFITTALLLFQLVSSLRDDRSAILSVCIFFFYGHFMGKISGGLAQSFAYPLLIGYLLSLARNKLMSAGVVILILSVFNPYIFLLCFVTHFVFMLHNHWPPFMGRFTFNHPLHHLETARNPKQPPQDIPSTVKSASGSPYPALLPIAAGVLIMALTHVFLKPVSFGELVSRADMIGNSEYTATGRYHIMPVPSLVDEILRLWEHNLPFKEWGPVGGGASLAFWVVVVTYAISKKRVITDFSAFRVFAYLFISSILLYVLSRIVLMKLFLPTRYIEFTFNILFCVGTAVCLKVVLEESFLKRVAFPMLIAILVMVGALRLKNVGIYDYSDSASLYNFFTKTPKDTVVAGPPDLMDNILTFSCRKAFVTYELSHTWIRPYWDRIKGRTYDFLRAYYAMDPDDVRKFCRLNAINYLVIRDEDFAADRITGGKIYFEPFGSYIKKSFASRTYFAVIDNKLFPPLYQLNGIRVITPR